jgi:hypothetical protein
MVAEKPALILTCLRRIHVSQTIRLPLFSLWSQYNLILFLQFVLEGYLAKQHRLLSQTIRLPVFSLWSQYNLLLFL